MDISIIGERKPTIRCLGSGECFRFPHEDDIRMIIDGEGITSDEHTKHSVNLINGRVTKPGLDCEIEKVYLKNTIAEIIK